MLLSLSSKTYFQLRFLKKWYFDKVQIFSYRMAPEHPFPIPIEDCYNLTKYVLESRNEFGDTDKVIISGDSAGGNITCVVSQRLNAENVKKPILQVLIYPWTQMVFKLNKII